MIDTAKLIAAAAAIRDELKAAIDAAKTAQPHLCNAAGHLQQAITNLQGHADALAAKAATATPDKAGK